jgi:hypothetical protein
MGGSSDPIARHLTKGIAMLLVSAVLLAVAFTLGVAAIFGVNLSETWFICLVLSAVAALVLGVLGARGGDEG